MNKVIEVRHLTKKYKELTAVNDLSFDVYEGEILGLLGPNGSGKSTTINCLLSLLNYDKGEIRIFNEKMTPSAYDIKRQIGVIFQDVAVFDELTVYENLDYFCGLYVQDKKTRCEYIDDAIKLVGLEHYQKFYPKQLSGGLLRRLNIACGIVHKPKLIFLDEPTVAVDPQSRNNILSGIQTLRDNGATIVYTTHYMEEVEILCDRIIILDKGEVLAEGTASELKVLANTTEKVTVEGTELTSEQLAHLKKSSHIDDLIYDGKILLISYAKGENNLVDLIEYLKKEGICYTKIFSERPTLNDVFLELTGKELRD